MPIWWRKKYTYSRREGCHGNLGGRIASRVSVIRTHWKLILIYDALIRIYKQLSLCESHVEMMLARGRSARESLSLNPGPFSLIVFWRTVLVEEVNEGELTDAGWWWWSHQTLSAAILKTRWWLPYTKLSVGSNNKYTMVVMVILNCR